MSLLPDYNPDDYANETKLVLNPACYPNFGLYNKITDIIHTSPEDVLKLSINEQMQFSDAITRRYAKNELFKNQQIMGFQTSGLPINKSHPNITAIGNMAFMTFHNPEQFTEYYNEMIKILNY